MRVLVLVATIAVGLTAMPALSGSTDLTAPSDHPDTVPAPSGTSVTGFAADLKGSQWNALALAVNNGTLTITRDYPSLNDTWLTQGTLLYDERFDLVGGVFSMIRAGGSNTTLAAHLRVGDQEVGVEVEDDPGGAMRIQMSVEFIGLPERVRVLLWSAGPYFEGTVTVTGDVTVEGSLQGSSAYAVTADDFTSVGQGTFVVDGRVQHVMPIGSFDLSPHHNLIGVALPRGGAALTMGDSVCRCEFYEKGDWVDTARTFHLSGAPSDLPLVMAADARFPSGPIEGN